MTELAAIINDLLSIGKDIRLTVTGNSMYPFLREYRDSVLLKRPSGYKPAIGDIVLVVKPGERYILHRIIKISHNGFYLLGDAQTRPEGPISSDGLVAYVSCIYRDGKIISAAGFFWRALSYCWIILRPLRSVLIRLAARLPRRKVRK